MNMLDPSITSVVESRVSQDLEDRRMALAEEINQFKGKMGARRVLQSSATVIGISRIIRSELRIRANLIWKSFARAIAAKKIPFDNLVGTEVKELIAELLENHSTDLPEHYKKVENIIGVTSLLVPISRLREDALARVNNEIDFALLQYSENSGPQPGITIYQSAGIIQTGQGSRATVGIIFGTEERQLLERALEATRIALEESDSIDESIKEEAFELVSDVEAEIKREHPNTSKIRGSLISLATTIQASAAAPHAYQLLKGAAALIGLDLP